MEVDMIKKKGERQVYAHKCKRKGGKKKVIC